MWWFFFFWHAEILGWVMGIEGEEEDFWWEDRVKGRGIGIDSSDLDLV